MVKVIRYKYLSCEVNHGTEEHPDLEPVFIDKVLGYSEIAEDIAKTEAYQGEYAIEEVDEPAAPPTDAERIAELEEALAMLLSGVTE